MSFFNEFFTPPELIEKMLNRIPETLWNTKTKWLEPTCGDGGFMIAIYDKLFHHSSYVKEYPDVEERKTHIYKQLYMVDINPINVEKTRRTFGLGGQIFCADFLSWNCDTTFDVIVGNPPFQTPSESYCNGALRKGSRKKIYEKIIEKALSLLSQGGHACFICPLNLWSGKGCVKNTYEKIITQYYPKYIYLNNVKKKWFPHIGQNLKMCFFVVSNEEKKTTIVENIDGKEYEIELRNINPVEDWTPENVALLDTYLTETTSFLRTSDKNRFFKIGNYKLIQNPDRIFFAEPTEELLKDSYYGIEKLVLFRMKPFALGFYDEGTLLLSSQIYFLPLTKYSKEEKEKIISFFQSETYKKLVKLTTTSQFLKCGIFVNIDKIIHML
jgi:hypothetical protein